MSFAYLNIMPDVSESALYLSGELSLFSFLFPHRSGQWWIWTFRHLDNQFTVQYQFARNHIVVFSSWLPQQCIAFVIVTIVLVGNRNLRTIADTIRAPSFIKLCTCDKINIVNQWAGQSQVIRSISLINEPGNHRWSDQYRWSGDHWTCGACLRRLVNLRKRSELIDWMMQSTGEFS